MTFKEWCIANNKEELLAEWDYDKNYNLHSANGQDISTPEKIAAKSNLQVWWKCARCGHEWQTSTSRRTKNCGCLQCKDVRQAETRRQTIKNSQNNLVTWCKANNKTTLLEEWNYIKNYPIQPDEIRPFSNKKYWWKGKCGHEWQATASSRTNMNSGCPVCHHYGNSMCEQAVYYYIKQAFPDAINGDKHIGMELDIFIPSLNVGIEYDGNAWHKQAKKLKADNNKNQLCAQHQIELIRIREPNLPVLDKCTMFYRTDSVSLQSLEIVIVQVLKYLTSTIHINVNIEKDLPDILIHYQKNIQGQCLTQAFPDIAAEWDWQKNKGITPDMVHSGTRQSFWWKCHTCNYSWKASVSMRTRKQTHCPHCSALARGQYRKKKIQNIETGQIFDSLLDAAIWCHGNSGNILNCCKGKYQKSYGYHWKYIDN